MQVVNRFMKHLLVIPVFFIVFFALGQQIQYDPDVEKYYKEAVSFYQEANYQEANRSFRKALSTNKVLPTDLSYYFAETLYHLGQYQNSKNFVEKYLGLTGYSGDFYEQATNLKELLETQFNAITDCHRCNRFGYRLQPCDQCGAAGFEIGECHECKGLGNSLCPKCTGKGVNITVDAFGQRLYEECDICKGVGHTPCKLCNGTKIVSRTCMVCLGTKVRASTTICDHSDEQELPLEKKKSE